jgi:hypothetical protein
MSSRVIAVDGVGSGNRPIATRGLSFPIEALQEVIKKQKQMAVKPPEAYIVRSFSRYNK